jgi:hypothetical protein
MKPDRNTLDAMASTLLAWREIENPTTAQYADAVNECRAVAAVLPANAGLDFVTMFEAWGDHEANVTATLLDLVMVALATRYVPGMEKGGEVTITGTDLRAIVEQFDYERTEEAGVWTLKFSILPEISSAEG